MCLANLYYAISSIGPKMEQNIVTSVEKVITPNVIRALRKIKEQPTMLAMLVDAEYIDDVKALLNVTSTESNTEDAEDFSIRKEFASTYRILKEMLRSLAASSTRDIEDLKIINSAQKFLEFIMKNEVAMNGIDSVKKFKEAVYTVLDETDPKLRDIVITKLNELSNE